MLIKNDVTNTYDLETPQLEPIEVEGVQLLVYVLKPYTNPDEGYMVVAEFVHDENDTDYRRFMHPIRLIVDDMGKLIVDQKMYTFIELKKFVPDIMVHQMRMNAIELIFNTDVALMKSDADKALKELHANDNPEDIE